ncbi:polysaccharide deacetylase family protein [Clostridium swellfunianum]|uniref:polysaccharide deacetylase family protein n=1 Tax=Clostridium swellfunianum TaxID=1367462 RepID=UPI00202DC813|nr:polysaccharide deacetylase family protein [Clostridium swellfunianum]MCM0649532.1 polysaccharide deacetylase family protein [Clostridium swellfunianum]
MKNKIQKIITVASVFILFVTGCAKVPVQQNESTIILQAQKEDKAEQQQEKQDDLRKQEELKRQQEKTKLEDPIKLKAAINGQGDSKKIPILMYHSIKYEKDNELRIPKEKFKEQMEYLKKEGFNPLSLNELYSHMLLGSEIPQKPIVITFDDGYADNYTNAYPILKELGFKATVFVISGVVDKHEDYMTTDHLKEMDKNGISIEAHTVTHPKLDTLSYNDQLKELRGSKQALEKILGRNIDYIAYPYGKYNNDTLKLVEQLGYKMAFSTEKGLAHKSNGIYKLHRIYISEKYSINQFKQLVNTK